MARQTQTVSRREMLNRSFALSALADYRKAMTDFARATGTLLTDRGITIR